MVGVHLYSHGTVRGMAKSSCRGRSCYGDILVLYTDGVTEAVNEQGEEFWRRATRRRTAGASSDAGSPGIAVPIRRIRQFSGKKQQADITLVIARCLA